VSVMADWTDVVTTALLGTDRRPVPSPLPTAWGATRSPSDPATATLHLAAQHRAWSRAGSRQRTVEPPAVGPPLGDLAPAAAQELLGRLLDAAHPVLVNAWLAACVRRGQVISPDYWQLLAVLTSEANPYDRSLLGHALGLRGRWFLTQNPRWTRLARQLEEAATLAESSPPAGDVQEDEEIERVFAVGPDSSTTMAGGDDLDARERLDIPRGA
jgi:hypothetical protein